jgi:hypothetical protein
MMQIPCINADSSWHYGDYGIDLVVKDSNGEKSSIMNSARRKGEILYLMMGHSVQI